ncbi:hypothetical protein B0I74DRAFT_155310 [Yarrowia lipolytica]|nr:hypothetical protein B0I74DRAFT_155310 [Yarrowia lipolytica]
MRWTEQHDRVAQVHVRTHYSSSTDEQMVDYMVGLYPELDRETVRMHVRFWVVYYLDVRGEEQEQEDIG